MVVGGPDPAFNTRLASAITNAKKGTVSKALIESAIARGQGKSTSGARLESLTIEAMLPFTVGAIIECQTDQKLRTLQDIRLLVSRHGGSIASTSFLFERKGKVVFGKKEGISTDLVLDPAIEAGAIDVDVEDTGRMVVETEASQLSAVTGKLAHFFGLEVEFSDIVHVPKEDTLVLLSEENMAEIEEVVALLEEELSVQNVYINAR